MLIFQIVFVTQSFCDAGCAAMLGLCFKFVGATVTTYLHKELTNMTVNKFLSADISGWINIVE